MSMLSGSDQTTIYQRPVELLQNLIRFNTTNPPGNETECIAYVNHLLTGAGFETTLLALDPTRPNLVTRLAGRGNAPPLLLYGHVDVVTTENQVWQYPPFEGKLLDGYVWGRGALDMKGGVAMMLAALLRAKAEGLPLLGDVVLAIVSDEEGGGDYGAGYLVQNHAALFDGIRYAIGEVGGFTFYVGGQKFYPIMVTEKLPCLVKATVRGPSGHASLPARQSATGKLGYLFQQLDQRHLPVHFTPVARQMIEAIISALPSSSNLILHQLLEPSLTDQALKSLGTNCQIFDPLLHNTVNVTNVYGGEQIWGLPGKIDIDLAISLLPGCSPVEVLAELRQIVGDDVEFELVHSEPEIPEPDMGLFDTLAGILREGDQDGIPVPLLMPSPTDGRYFSRLGIQTYGFLPMNLPAEFNSLQTFHAADERISVEAMAFGTNAIYKVLQRFGNGHSVSRAGSVG
jgi:acetylornithine deacetylase/succinyl-diaminopimelate desuccinylase-like protein